MVKKVNAIQAVDTNKLVTKADYSTEIYKIEKKIPNHDKFINGKTFYWKIKTNKISN